MGDSHGNTDHRASGANLEYASLNSKTDSGTSNTPIVDHLDASNVLKSFDGFPLNHGGVQFEETPADSPMKLVGFHLRVATLRVLDGLLVAHPIPPWASRD